LFEEPEILVSFDKDHPSFPLAEIGYPVADILIPVFKIHNSFPVRFTVGKISDIARTIGKNEGTVTIQTVPFYAGSPKRRISEEE
jgi:hypothetical protein